MVRKYVGIFAKEIQRKPDKKIICEQYNSVRGRVIERYSMSLLDSPLQLIGILFLLSILPLIIVMGTSFLKLAVTFSILRNALGIQQVPQISHCIFALRLYFPYSLWGRRYWHNRALASGSGMRWRSAFWTSGGTVKHWRLIDGLRKL